MEEMFTEVRCDYFDEELGCWTIDAWINDSDEDGNGRVIGWVDGVSGNIWFKDGYGRKSPLAQEVAKEMQKEVRSEVKQQQSAFNETCIMLAADLFKKLYDIMGECNYQEMVGKIRELAKKFEQELDWQGDSDDRDYLEELEKFEERILAEYMDDHYREIQNAGEWIDLDQCEKAYRLGKQRVTWVDYTIDCGDTYEWDQERYYDDFYKWWASLSAAERENIYKQL